MRDDLTDIVFIIDKSGSMAGLENDTINGFNSFIEKQKQESGNANITTILFDTKYKIIHGGIDIKEVSNMTKEDYRASGFTALFDAIGKGITDVGYRLDKLSEDDKPSKVLFIITTDGEENSSKEFSLSKINKMITLQKDKYSWEFIFAGANIDSFSAGGSLGINKNRICNYTNSSVGIKSMYGGLSRSTSSYRNSGNFTDNWSETIA